MIPVIDGKPFEEAVRAVKNMVRSGLLNTPVTDGLKCRTTHHGQRRMNSESLKTMAQMLLPTPRANKDLDLDNEKLAKRNKGNLEEVIASIVCKGKLLPTATASAEKQGTTKDMRCGKSRKTALNHFVAKEIVGNNSQLNPLFVEEMMGFPYLWTLLPFLSRNGAATQ